MPKRIVIIYSNDCPTNGITSTLAYLGNKDENFQVFNWNPANKATFDMFEEVKPDLLVVDSKLTPNLANAIAEYDTKLVVCGNFIPNEIEPDLICFPHNISENIIKHTSCPFEIIEPAANLSKFRNGVKEDNKYTHILFFASAEIPTQKEINILGKLSSMELPFKIIGYHRPFVQYVGQVSISEIANFLASARIIIDVDQSCLFDVAAQGGFAISNIENDIFPKYESLEESILTWTANDPDITNNIKKISKAAKKKIMKKDTYFHRTATMFERIGWSQESTLTINHIDNVESK